MFPPIPLPPLILVALMLVALAATLTYIMHLPLWER